MNKLIVMFVATAISVSCSFGGSIVWGSIIIVDGSPTPVAFTAPGSDPFAGEAFLFLLTGPGATVVGNGDGTWNLNGATQLATSPAGTFGDGTWGAGAEPVSDANMSATKYYMVVLTSVSGAASLTDVKSGTYAVVTPAQLANYSEIEGTQKDGMLAWGSISGSEQNVAPVPEPASMALFGLGAGVIALRRRFKNKKA
ncbi:MAG: PEP-CTERM sorting domain-containing protein [Deltaproteobacteria bacterium]